MVQIELSLFLYIVSSNISSAEDFADINELAEDEEVGEDEKKRLYQKGMMFVHSKTSGKLYIMKKQLMLFEVWILSCLTPSFFSLSLYPFLFHCVSLSLSLICMSACLYVCLSLSVFIRL